MRRKARAVGLRIGASAGMSATADAGCGMGYNPSSQGVQIIEAAYGGNDVSPSGAMERKSCSSGLPGRHELAACVAMVHKLSLKQSRSALSPKSNLGGLAATLHGGMGPSVDVEANRLSADAPADFMWSERD